MGKILKFPLPKSNMAMVCPDCGKNSWELMTNDQDESSAYATMRCRTRSCNYSLSVWIYWGDDLREGA